MATHSSILAWRIPGTGEPGGLPSMGSHRVGDDWRDLVAAAWATACRLLCSPLSPKSAQIHVHWVSNAIQPSHPLLPPSPPALSLSQHRSLFRWVSSLHRWWPKYWSFSSSIILSNEYSGWISFKIDWFHLLAVQGTLKSLLQHNLKASVSSNVTRVNSWTRSQRECAISFVLKKKRASEDETAGWHHRCNGHELGQTSGDGEGQRGLVCCSPWSHEESDTTGQLNNKTTVWLSLNKQHSLLSLRSTLRTQSLSNTSPPSVRSWGSPDDCRAVVPSSRTRLEFPSLPSLPSTSLFLRTPLLPWNGHSPWTLVLGTYTLHQPPARPTCWHLAWLWKPQTDSEPRLNSFPLPRGREASWHLKSSSQ